jgi:hypothetical protein
LGREIECCSYLFLTILKISRLMLIRLTPTASMDSFGAHSVA